MMVSLLAGDLAVGQPPCPPAVTGWSGRGKRTTGGLIVAGAALYYMPEFIRARRGINVSFVYKELPPE